MSPQNVSTDVLRTLHRVHRQIADLKERLELGPKRIRTCEVHIAHQEEQLAAVRAEAKALRAATDKKQVQLKAGEEKIKDLEAKLLAAASNREYQVLKDQIEAQRMTNSVLDDEILEAWEKIEQFDKKMAEAKGHVETARQKAQQSRHEVDRQEPLIRGDLTRLETELKQCEASLPATVRELYNRIVHQKGEDALAAVENEYCGGCHQHVPLNVCAEIMLSHPMFCKTCGRLLYMPEDGSPDQ